MRLLNKFDWYILTIANPDGYWLTHYRPQFRAWRKNYSNSRSCPKDPANGVHPGIDLNRFEVASSLCWINSSRNFDTAWKFETDKCKETFQGNRPFDAPETTAIKVINRLIVLLFTIWLSQTFLSKFSGNVAVYLTVHSTGELFLIPKTGTENRRGKIFQLIQKSRGVKKIFYILSLFCLSVGMPWVRLEGLMWSARL